MFPKNNASPPTVAVGSIYLIADGTIQTSGASVRVKTAGGAWGAGAGSLAYDTTSGAIEYTPTQGETNGEWFAVAVYKASCTTACITVVTTAESTAGKVSLGADQSGATVGTVSTLTGHTAQTADHTAQITAIVTDTNELQSDDVPGLIAALNDLSAAEVNAEVDAAIETYKLDHLVAVADSDDPVNNSIIAKLASSDGDWSAFVGSTDSLQAVRDHGDAAWITATSVTVSDKTGFKLASDGLDLVTTWAVAITGDVTGNLSGSAGSVTGNVGGSVASVTAGVTLANDAIKAVTYDESTAFPIKSADTGATQIARTGADGDTLEDISDEIAAQNDVSVADILTTQMTESYAANGTSPTLAQAQFAIHQMLMQFAISGTNISVKKLDDSTQAFVVTLDDGTDPTSARRQ
jgi:hypothetical protein